MRKFLMAGAVLASATLIAGAASAANLIQNGDFATGDFTDWTLASTGNGLLGNGATTPAVSSFDVTGGGAQEAAHLEVGENAFTGQYEGGSLSQDFTSAAGLVSVSADYAVISPDFTNADAGRFIVQIDGVTLEDFDLGQINQGTTDRGSLAGTDVLTAGNHTLSIFVERRYQTADTPQQYLTNISVDGAAGGVPEPASWALMISGFGLVGAAARRRRSAIA